METLTLILSKTILLNLIPFGRFKFKWTNKNNKPDVIAINKLDIRYQTAMPYTTEDEKMFCKIMKEHKTQILTNFQQNIFYTRISTDWIEIDHPKLRKYRQFLLQENLEDNEETFEAFLNL